MSNLVKMSRFLFNNRLHTLVALVFLLSLGACGGGGGSSTSNDGGDTTAPTISNVLSSNITANSATITWTTNEASDSQVAYGLTTSYTYTTTLDTNLVTSHSQLITGLTATTLYHYGVASKDASSNLGNSGDNIFTTTSPAGSVTYSWVAPAGAYDLAGYKLYYSQTSGAYGSFNVDVRGAGQTTYVETGLGSGTWYAVVKAYDTSGNESAPSNEETFPLP